MPRRQNAEEEVRGKELEAVWDDWYSCLFFVDTGEVSGIHEQGFGVTQKLKLVLRGVEILKVKMRGSENLTHTRWIGG